MATFLDKMYEDAQNSLNYVHNSIAEENLKQDQINESLIRQAQDAKNGGTSYLAKKSAIDRISTDSRISTIQDIMNAIKIDPALGGLSQAEQEDIVRSIIQFKSSNANGEAFKLGLSTPGYEKDKGVFGTMGDSIASTGIGAEGTIRQWLGAGADLLGFGAESKSNKLYNENANAFNKNAIKSINSKKEGARELQNRIQEVDDEISKLGPYGNEEDLNRLIQRKQALLDIANSDQFKLTEEEQRAIADGSYKKYHDNLDEIASNERDRARFQGDSLIGRMLYGDEFVNEEDSFTSHQKNLRLQRLEEKYKDAGLDPSWSNFDYALEKTMVMLPEGVSGWGKTVGAVLPYVLTNFLPGGQTMTVGKIAQIGFSWSMLGADGYSRFVRNINEQYKNNPDATPDQIAAGVGAMGSVFMDFFGSRYLMDAPARAAANRILSRSFSEASRKAAIAADKAGREFGQAAKGAAYAKVFEEELNKSMKEGASEIANIMSSEGTKLGNKVLDKAIELPKKALDKVKGINDTLHKGGLGVQDFAKAGTGLGFENMGSSLFTQYGETADTSKVSFEKAIDSAVEGLYTGAAFHAPGVGVHAGLGAVSKAVFGDKYENLRASTDTQMSNLEKAFKDKKVSEEDLNKIVKNNTDSVSTLKSKVKSLADKVLAKAPEGALKYNEETLSLEVADKNKVTPSVQKALEQFNKGSEQFLSEINQHEANNKVLTTLATEQAQSEVKEALKEDGTAIFNDSEMDNISKKFKAFNEDIQTDLLKEQGYTEEQAQNVLKRLNAKDEDILSDKDLGFKEGVDNALFEMNVDSTVAQGVSEEVQDAIISQDANKLKEAITNSMNKDKDSEEYKATDRLQRALKANAGFDYTSDKPTLMKDSLVDFGNTKGNKDVYENLLSEVRKEEGFNKTKEDLSKVSDEELINKFKAKPSKKEDVNNSPQTSNELKDLEDKIKELNDKIEELETESEAYEYAYKSHFDEDFLKEKGLMDQFIDLGNPEEALAEDEDGYFPQYYAKKITNALDKINQQLKYKRHDLKKLEERRKELQKTQKESTQEKEEKESTQEEIPLDEKKALVQELAARYALDSASRNYENTNKLEDLESTPEQAINYVEEKLGEKLNDKLKDAIRDLYKEDGIGINSYLTAGFSEYNQYHSYKKYDTEDKAQEAIKKNGLEDTHEVVKLYGGKYVIDEKLKNEVNDPLYNLVHKVSKDLKDGNPVDFTEVKEELKKAIQDSNIALLKDEKFLAKLDNLNKDKWNKFEAAVGLAIDNMQMSSKVSSKNNLKEGNPEGNPQYKHNYTYARNRANITRKKIAQKQFNSMAGSEPTLYKKVPWLKAITDVPTLRRVAFTNLMNIANASGNTVLDVLTSKAMQDAIKRDDRTKISNLLQDFNLPATSVDDIETLLTHVKMLANSGLANPSELENLRATLSLLQQLIKNGHFKTSNNSSLGNLLWEKQTSEHDTEKFITKTTALTANINAIADKFGIKKEKLEYTCADVDGMLGKIIKGLSPIGDMQLFINSLKGVNKLLSKFRNFDEITFDKNFNIIFKNSTILELLQAEANNTNNEALKLLIANKGDMSQFTPGNKVQALSAYLTSKTIQSLFYGLANTDKNSFREQLDTIQANSIRIMPIDNIEDFYSKNTSTGKSVSKNLEALATSLGIKKGSEEYKSFLIFMFNSMKDNGFITESLAGHRILQLAIENEQPVPKVSTDYFDPDILDNLDTINSGNIEQYIKDTHKKSKDIQYVREHYGDIIFNMALKVLKDRVRSSTSKGIDRDSDIARALRLWSKSLEVKGKVLQFNTHEQLTKPENFTEKEILEAVNNFIIPSLEDSTSLNLTEELDLSNSTNAKLNQAYKFLNLKAGQKNVASLGDLNQGQLNDLGSKIYDYINKEEIHTSYGVSTTKGTGTGVTPTPSKSNPLKHIADTSGSMYDISKAFKRPSLVATNSIDLAISAYSNNANVSSSLTFIKDMANRMSLDFMSVRAVDPDSSPVDSLFSYSFNGRRIMAHEYANVVATVALNNLSDASKPMDPDGDFYKKLVASTSHATGQYFLQNNIVNRTEFFNNMGKSIIKSMGLSRSVLGDSMYNAMVVQAGIDAAIMLNREGLIDIEYISTSPVKGKIDIRSVNEGPQVGYIAGIKLKTGNSLVNKVRDNVNNCKVKDGSTTKYVLDECLGIDFHSRDKTYTATEYTAEQKKYADEFGTDFSNYQGSELIQVNEDGLMRINTSSIEGNPDYVYFTEDQYLKDDDTYVEPNRLVELALQQKVGWIHNNNLADKIYADCSILDNMSEAEIDTAIEAIDSWGKAGTLYADVRWGRLKSFIRYEDPKEYTQVYAQNVHSKNVSSAKQFFKNYTWYKENKASLSGDPKVYNKLTNTKNNRFYIPGQESNRREDKYFGRPLFYAQTCSIDLANKDEVFLAKSTILSNLETKYDKMSREELDTAWDNIIADEAFQNIFKAYRNNGDVYEAINKFNEKEFTYTVAGKDKTLKIAYDTTTLSTLEALTSELRVDGKTFDESHGNTKIKNFLSFKSGNVTDWRLAMEVDGLNNGSAWKNLMSNSLANAQEGSLLAKARAIAGGISTDYDTFVEATAEGNVDAYNLNGRSARFNAIHKFVASAVMQDEYKNIVSLLGVVFDKNQDQMVELLSEILDRDMMKYPTMYFTYGAGFKALIANMSNIMSKQTSHFLATANKEQLRDYFDKLFVANNGNPIKVSYYDPKTGTYTDGYIKAEDASVSFSSGLSLLDPEVRKNSNIFFEDNKTLTNSLEEDIITPLWNGFNESSEGMRDTVKTSTEVSNVLAQVYNSKVAEIITEVYNDNHGVLNLADLDARLDKLNESFDSVLNIGEDKTTLQLLKQDIKNDTKKLFSILTKQYGSKAIVKGNVETIMKSNLGAGEDPMTIHTMDNNTMTHFQTLLRNKNLGEVLPIHDASYLTPKQILEGGSDINKVFFRDAMLFPITLKNRNDLLTRVISQLNANTFGLNNTDSLLAQADRVYNRANDELHDMIALRLEAINNLLDSIKEDGDNAKATLKVNQYQFLGFTNYQPTRGDLKDIKSKLIELGCANESLTVDKAINWISTNANTYLDLEQIKSITNNKSPTNGSIILDPDIVKNVNTMEELMEKIKERTKVDLTSQYRDYLAKTADDLLSTYKQEMGLANNEDPQAITNSINNLKKCTATNKAEAIRGAYNTLGIAVNYAVVNKEHIRHQFTSSVNHMRSLLSDQPTQLESLLLMHNACNTNKELTEDRAFLDLYREIFNDISPIQFDTEVDTDRNTVFYEDSGEISYSGLRNFINKNIQQSKIHNTEHSANMTQKAVVLHHFNQIRRSVQNDINSALSNKNGKKVQLVFTLRTKMDILKMQAASQLINEIPEYKDKVSIVVTPGMTDMVTAGINRNTQINETIKDRLTTQNGKGKNASILIKSVTIAPNKYKDLAAIGTSLGTPMTKEYIDSGTRAGKYESYTINLKPEEVDGKIESTNLKPCTRSTQRNRTSPVVIHRTNEFGVNMGSNGTRVDIMNRFNLNLLDLETTPLSNRELTSTIYSDIFELTSDDLEARFYEEGATIRVEDAQRNSIDVNNNFSSLLETNNVLLIDTVSDGTIKDKKLASILNNTDITKELVTKYQAEYKARQARYANQAISWDEAISPIYVEVPNNTLNGTIKAVFQTTLDISINPRDLGTESFQFDRVTNRLLNFTPGSELAKFGDFNKLKQLHKFGTTKYTMDTTRRINIPQDMINKDLLNTDAVNGRLDSNLLMTNQLAVEQLVGNRHLDVIKFSPSFGVDSLEHNEQGQLTHIIGSKSYTTRIAYTGNVPIHNATTIAKETNKSFAGRTKELINSATRRFMGWHNYRGDYTGSKNPNAEKYNDMSNRDMETHINRLMTLDKARGVDNSHLEGLIPLFTNLAMKINLVVNREIGRNGGEGLTWDHANRQKYVSIEHGIISNGVGSNLELLFHELVHGICEHLNMDPTATKQATQLYTYVASHITPEHFTDCSKQEAEELINYIFNSKDVDHIAEFLAYAMTNKSFQNAINNMGINSQDALPIFSRTKGVVSRVLGTFTKFLGKNNSEIPNNILDGVFNIFNITYENSQKVWEDVRKEDLLSDEEYIEKLATLNEPMYKVFKQGANIISSTISNITDSSRVIGSITNPDMSTEQKHASEVVPLLTDMANKLIEAKTGFLPELMTSLSAVSHKNWEYIKLRQLAKKAIDTNREQASSVVNNFVKDTISHLDPKVQSALTRHFVKADISCLFDNIEPSERTMSLLTNPKVRKEKIKSLEHHLRSLNYGKYYVNASKGLADYIVKGINTSGLGYKNAYEVANLSGTSQQTDLSEQHDTVRTVDKLITLYAMDMLDAEDPSVYKALDLETVEALSTLHNSIKQSEFENVYFASNQRHHIPKGQLHGGKSVGSYKIYPMKSKKAVDWSKPTSVTKTKLDPFYKGIMKEDEYITAHHRWRSPIPIDAGIFAMTDVTMGRVAGGVRVGSKSVSTILQREPEVQRVSQYLTKRILNLNSNNPSFINPDSVDGGIVPKFNHSDKLIGSDFELNPNIVDEKIGRNVKVTSVFGDLYGSIIERSSSKDVNIKAAQAVEKIYQDSKDKGDFIFVNDLSEDANIRDYYSNLPFEVKNYFEARKYEGVPVRKIALDIAFGKSTPSSKKVDEEYYNLVRQGIAKVSDRVKHVLHHGYVANTEEAINWLVKTGKDNIVIKGLSVSINNILSNTILLGLSGLSPVEAMRGQVEAMDQLRELETLQNRMDTFNLKRLNKTYTDQDFKLEKATRESLKALPIYPLYEKGILGTIAEDLQESDRFLKDLIDKYIPDTKLNSLAHFVGNTPKSVIYKMLRDLATYGDKTAKYAMYKNLPDTLSEDEKLRQVTSTFIDYGIPLPTGLDLIESLGISNFLKYGLGIQSVITNTLTRKPEKALTYLLTQSALGVNLPDIFDSLLGINSIMRGANVPGIGIFMDSISALPTAKVANAITDSI